ncbi:MAG: hypothetical protein WC924_05955 [Candidatus Gracilibacteria bacterium]
MAGKVEIKDFGKKGEIENPANPEEYIVTIVGRCERDAQPFTGATGTYFLERGKMGTFQINSDGSFELTYEIRGVSNKAAVEFTVAVQVEDSGYIWREYRLPALRPAATAATSTTAPGLGSVSDPTVPEPSPDSTASSPTPEPEPAQKSKPIVPPATPALPIVINNVNHVTVNCGRQKPSGWSFNFFRKREKECAQVEDQENDKTMPKKEESFVKKYGRWIFRCSVFIVIITIIAALYDSGYFR